MAGSLAVMPRPSPLNGGVTVAGAQLFCYNAGTTTKRNTYTTSALSVANANPLVADANGRFGAMWIDPDDGSYKLVLASASDTDPPASPFWTEDNIPVLGAGLTEGSFTGTLTGMDASTTGTVEYKVFANAAGVGKSCILRVPSSTLGTSNTTAMTMTGLPAAVQPTANVWVPCLVRDNGVDVPGAAFINAAAPSVITFYTDATLSATGFTPSGSKGLIGGTQIAFAL
jgi:hypothetical protein